MAPPGGNALAFMSGSTALEMVVPPRLAIRNQSERVPPFDRLVRYRPRFLKLSPRRRCSVQVGSSPLLTNDFTLRRTMFGHPSSRQRKYAKSLVPAEIRDGWGLHPVTGSATIISASAGLTMSSAPQPAQGVFG